MLGQPTRRSAGPASRPQNTVNRTPGQSLLILLLAGANQFWPQDMVREMLRPMLKQWLDEHLPQMVEEHVKREITRITGRPL